MGKNIYLVTDSIENSVKGTRLTFASLPAADSPDVEKMCVGTQDNGATVFDLLYYYIHVFYNMPIIHIMYNTGDNVGCGTAAKPCLTLTYVFTNLPSEPSAPPKTIAFHNALSLEIAEDFVSKQTRTKITTDLIVEPVMGNGAKTGLIVVSNNVKFGLCEFSLATTLTIDAMFVKNAAGTTFTIDNCKFTAPATFPRLLFQIVAGSFVFQSSSIDFVAFTAGCVLLLSQPCSFSSSSFSGISLGGSSLIQVGPVATRQQRENAGAAHLTIDKCAFINVRTENGVGSASVLTFGKETPRALWSLLISQSNFFSCVAVSNARGGVLDLLITQAADNIRLESCLFQACGASNAASQGGVVYLETTIGTAGKLPFDVVNCVFQDNGANSGKDFFFKVKQSDQITAANFAMNFDFITDSATSFMRQINTGSIDDIFNILYSYTSPFIYAAAGGGTSSGCGKEGSKCGTLLSAVGRLNPIGAGLVFVGSEVSLGGKVSFLKQTTIKPSGVSSAKIKLDAAINHIDDPIFTSAEGFSIEFCIIEFDRGFGFVASSLFSQTTPYPLSLSSCSVSPSTNAETPFSLSLSFAFLSAGTLLMESVTVSKLLFNNVAFQFTGTSSANLNRVILNSLALAAGKDLFVGSVTEGSLVFAQIDGDGVVIPSGSLFNFHAVGGMKKNAIPTVTISSSSFTNLDKSHASPFVQCNYAIDLKILRSSFSISSLPPSSSPFLKVLSSNSLVLTDSLFGLPSPGSLPASAFTCDWNDGLVQIASSPSAALTGITIQNATNGALLISSGSTMAVSLSRVMVEDSNPQFSAFPSFRRNIKCSGASVTVTLQGGGGGGGGGAGTPFSYWFSSGSTCTIAGLAATDSLYFIPTLTSVTRASTKNGEGKYPLTFAGTCLIPCNLQYVIASKASSAAATVVKTVAFVPTSDTAGSGEVEGDVVDGAANNTEILVWLSYKRDSAASGATMSFVISKQGSGSSDGDGRNTQSGGTAMTAAFVVFLLLFLAAAGVIAVLIILMRRKNVEKAVLPSKYEVTGSDIPKCPPSSSASLEREGSSTEFLERGESYVSSKGSGGRAESVGGFGKKDVEMGRTDSTVSTTSLNHLVSGYSCESPFDKVVLDVRECLYNKLFVQREERDEDETHLLCGSVLFWVSNGLEYLFHANVAKNIIFHLSPYVIMFGEEGAIVLGSHPALLELFPEDVQAGQATGEAQRWKAPEILSGEVAEGTERTAAYALGMVTYSILKNLVPFAELDFSSCSAKILNGERPDVGSEEAQNAPYFEVVVSCWNQDPMQRPLLAVIRKQSLEKMPHKAEEEEKEEKEEGEN